MKAYFFVNDDWNGYGVPIIAENMKEARKIAWEKVDNDYTWTEMCSHITSIPNADISGLQSGVFDGTPEDGLQRELYAWYETKCPICGKEARVSKHDNGKICCDECAEEENK